MKVHGRTGTLILSAVALAALSLAAAIGAADKGDGSRGAAYPFVFRDAGEDAGLLPDIAGIRGHGAAWGDVDGSGWPSLFVATFDNSGSKASMFFRNEKGKFRLDDQDQLRTSGMGSGALFIDLTNNGRLDLYVSNCVHGKDGPLAAPSVLFRNDGGGKFTDVSKDSGACPAGYAGRGLAAIDFNGDGLIDLVMCERYYSDKVKLGQVLYRNLGNYRFEDVTEKAGLPVGLACLGVAVADVNDDGLPDIFLVAGNGDNRLYLNDGKGHFAEAAGSRDIFHWKVSNAEDTPAGVCIADVNGDGLPDIVVGHHFKQPWKEPVPIRLYLNRGIKDGVPTFEDVTEAAGLKPLAMKAPHVEIQDFDNDGRPDIFVSIVKFKDGKPFPVIYHNAGNKDGIPRFEEHAWDVNDFPNKDHLALKRSGDLFDKVIKDKTIIYMAAGPTCDYDRDGKLDILLTNWWVEDRSLLLRNETPGGNWLDVRVEGSKGVNRMGVGSKVKLYLAGKLGEANAMLGSREISAGYGYCSGQEAAAHFGLGKTEAVDIEVTLPFNKGTLAQKNVKANQRVTVKKE